MGIRIEPEILYEIDSMAEALSSNRSLIAQECLRYGIVVFKKVKPEVVKLIENQKQIKERIKKAMREL